MIEGEIKGQREVVIEGVEREIAVDIEGIDIEGI